MTTKVTERMTPAQARQFDRFSVGNAIAVKTVLKCGCEPYEDVFTYRRWQALGKQVRRGEKAIKLPVIREVLREGEDGDQQLVKRFGVAAVFCRCQVDQANGATPHPASTIAQFASPVKAAKIDTLMQSWKEL